MKEGRKGKKRGRDCSTEKSGCRSWAQEQPVPAQCCPAWPLTSSACPQPINASFVIQVQAPARPLLPLESRGLASGTPGGRAQGKEAASPAGTRSCKQPTDHCPFVWEQWAPTIPPPAPPPLQPERGSLRTMTSFPPLPGLHGKVGTEGKLVVGSLRDPGRPSSHLQVVLTSETAPASDLLTPQRSVSQPCPLPRPRSSLGSAPSPWGPVPTLP